ncbi:hypothetical protein DXB57_10045 [Bacteroides fragilis]|uniref:Uncharacterized protein n=1 Tax=Bacteroides fragilis TaxID=817 RepID=A0A0I9RSC2_BACFG|nr:hypothetical protein DXB57_10045 [Bacteroides fragilis]RGV52726.1 hypothetical protein DWW08_13120 [Bacteroides fragilis]RGV83875.1 hypothetical protein DWW00_17590 [Bacteroides fragilis]RHH71789.1 hypothetical protein DW198_02110 [Bacteroides fragilis]
MTNINTFYPKILFINYLDKQEEETIFVPKDVRFLKQINQHILLIINNIFQTPPDTLYLLKNVIKASKPFVFH